MKDLIKALNILLKYGNPDYPCQCSYDQLYIDIDPKKVSDDDKKKLDDLGFFPGEEEGCEEGFISFKYGSC